MHGVSRGLLVGLIAAVLGSASCASAQQTPETFRWIDFHSSRDQDVVVWVTRALESEKWTAIREIGVEFDAALVVTTTRKSPDAPVGMDTFDVWSVSLTNHAVTAVLKGANLRLLDWMLFAVGQPRELGALYDDCHECNASTFFTAFYYDIRQHGWSARWMRGSQAIPLSSAHAPQGVSVTTVYGLLAEPNGHEMMGTWNHFDFGKQKPAEDYVYQYDVDPWAGLDRTQMLNGKEAESMKVRLCQITDAISGVARGQDSQLCLESVKPARQRRSAAAN